MQSTMQSVKTVDLQSRSYFILSILILVFFFLSFIVFDLVGQSITYRTKQESLELALLFDSGKLDWAVFIAPWLVTVLPVNLI